MLTVLAWCMLVIAVLFTGARFTGLLDRILAPGSPPDFSFSPTASVPEMPNYFILCPDGECPRTDRMAPSPELHAPLDDVVRAMMATAGRHGMELKKQDRANHQFVFLARTPVWRFPDWVVTRLEFAGAHRDGDVGRTKIYLFSRSVYGRGDFGKNAARAQAWMSDIQRNLSQHEDVG